MEHQDSILVVVQGDAVCPDWMSHWGACPAEGWSLLEQEEWEPRQAFLARLHSTLGRCSLEGRTDQTIVLVIGAGADGAAVSQRWTLSMTLLQHLAALGGGRLVLVQGYGGDARGEQDLAALAADLGLESEESDVVVATRIAATPRSTPPRRPSAPPLRSDIRATAARPLAQTA